LSTYLDANVPLPVILARPRGEDGLIVEHPVGDADLTRAAILQRACNAREVHTTGELDGVSLVQVVLPEKSAPDGRPDAVGTHDHVPAVFVTALHDDSHRLARDINDISHLGVEHDMLVLASSGVEEPMKVVSLGRDNGIAVGGLKVVKADGVPLRVVAPDLELAQLLRSLEHLFVDAKLVEHPEGVG